MSEKLLPCPFCGAAFKMGQEPNDNHPVAGQFYLYHDYGPLGSVARICPISINRHFYTEAEAITAWNTRAAAQADADLERIKRERDQAVEALKNPPKHRFWGAGEPDCPREIKAGNGELHTLRCKVCEEDSPRNPVCLAAIEGIANAS